MSERSERTIGTVGYSARRAVRITPEPTDEEVAAIVAAVEGLWPRPAGAVPAAPPTRWRFSGRWWSKPVPARRDRPW